MLLEFKDNNSWVDREGEERPWPYLLGHTPMERLFISPSHLQHSDTAAVKHSLPHDTSSRRDDSESKRYTRATTKPVDRPSGHETTRDLAVQKKKRTKKTKPGIAARFGLVVASSKYNAVMQTC